MKEPIRVLVVDDSAFMRKVISDLIGGHPDMVVVDTARNGQEALEKVRIHRPEVITLDVEMPIMDGLTALSRLMEENPLPVVMLSSLTQANAATTIEALARGAVDFVPKPSGTISLDLHKVREELWRKIRIAARARVARVVAGRIPPSAEHGFPQPPGRGPVVSPGVPSTLVVIGSSTGGPGALHQLLPALPADFPAPLIVVQHMPPGFTASLAQRLNQCSAIEVREASEGDSLTPGQALIAPGDWHLVVGRHGRVVLNQDEPVHGLRPAVDVTLQSAAALPCRVVAVILTGMGFDGVRGVREVKQRDGQVIAQDEQTCVVYGMPRAVVELGLADSVLPVGAIAGRLVQLVAVDRAEPVQMRK